MRKFDKIIIGAGLYGCYAANLCGKRNETVLVLDMTKHRFSGQHISIRQGYIWDIIIREAFRLQ